METMENKRLRKLRELGQDRPLMAGSINRVERKDARGRVTVFHLLTFKEAGKTRSVYVPKDLVGEVQFWIRNHRRVKQVLAEISTLSIAIIRKYVPEKRAAAASRRGKASSR
jgi:hypothetical protein